MSVTLFADLSATHITGAEKTVSVNTSKKLHTLNVARLTRIKAAKIKDVQRISKRSKKLHTLDVVRLQRKVTKIKARHKETLANTSKKLHTLDIAKLRRSKIAKIKNVQKVDHHKVVRVKTSKKLHTLKIVKLKRTDVKKVNSRKVVLTKISKKLHPSKVQKIVKKKIHTVKKKVKPIKLAKVLKRQAKPLSLQKKTKKQKRVTLSDIFFKSSRSTSSSRDAKTGKASNIINIAKTKLGRKYVWGAVGKRGTFDCSGFTSYVYKKNGIHIPRTSRNQAKYGKYISRNNLKKGDLIFFDTSKRRKGYVNHVGIYLGNGKFIHASSAKKKVVVSSLSKFYAQRYVGARRPS